MASYTTSLRLVQPATGEYSGSWGTQVNNGLTALVDTSVAGTATITMTAADYTLSTANGAADEARAMVLNLTGAPGAARNVICPAVSKIYIVYNNTTGGFAQTLKTAAGTGISVPNGSTAYLRCDGTNVVAAVNYLGSLTLGSALATSSGGTGLTSFTANRVFYASSTSAVGQSANLTFDGTTLTAAGFSGPLNGTVGATTPNTGSFTTLTTSSTVTLNGGTANGVAYLNASKVLTTGSALTFDGTIFSNALTANATYSELLRLRNNGAGDNTGAKLSFNFSGTERGYVGTFFSSGWITEISGTDVTRFLLGGSEQMRLTSTGLGIGTSSPGAKLHVSGGRTLAITGNENYSLGIGRESNTNAYYLGVHSTSNPNLLFSNNAGTTNMTLTYDGNLGLGVTPSAWGSNYRIEQFSKGSGAGGFIGDANSEFMVGRNAYHNGTNWIYYASSNNATIYQQSSGGAHIWYTAPSGTAGNAISFTQAMTLDASGRLLVGTTSAAGNAGLQVKGASSGYARIEGTSSTLFAGDAPQLITGGAATESALRAEGALLFAAGGATERARITSGGAFYINTISSVGGANTQMVVKGVATNTQQVCAFWNPSATNTQYFLSFGTDTTYTERGYITWNGTTTAIANASDQRLKTNIVDAPSALAKVDAIKIRSFDFIADNRHIDYGVIAQELENVVPAAVFKGADNEDGSIDKPWSVGLEPLIPVLVKALQEQQALIQQLTARVAALEAQP